MFQFANINDQIRNNDRYQLVFVFPNRIYAFNCEI